MNILQLCNRIPYPARDGGAIAMYNMTRGLQKAGCTVSMFTLNTPKHYCPPEEVPGSLIPQDRLTTVDTDTRVKAIPALLNLFSSRSYNIERFDQAHVKTALAELLQRQSFDVVQLEGLFMAPYLPVIRKYSRAPVVLRAHNVEYRIWERMAESHTAGPKRAYLRLLAARLRRYETAVLPAFDAVAAITPTDANLIRELAPGLPVTVQPMGIDRASVPESSPCWPNLAFHLGALDWMPNIEGVRWFMNEVWPEVMRHNPRARFHIAGRHIPREVYRYASANVTVHGEIDDAPSFMRQKGIMVVPLLSGSGMRVKIIEGMALSRPILSTTVGAEGIDYEDGKHLIIADEPLDFAHKLLSMMSDEQQCQNIGANARQRIMEQYTNEAVAGDLIAFYKKQFFA